MIALWLPLAVLLLLQPLMPASWPLWGAHVGIISLLLLLTALRLWRRGAVGHGAGGTVRWGAPALGVGVALLSLALALACAPPEAPQAQLRWAALTGLLHGGFFLLALEWMPGPEAEPRERRRVALGLALLLGAACAEQLVLGLWLQPSTEPDARLQGTLGNPNALGATLGATALLVLALGFTQQRRRREAGAAVRPMFIAALLALPLIWGLLLTRSRGAVAALLLTLLLLALRWRRWKLIAGVVLAAALLLVTPNPLRERLVALRPDHAFSRVFVWKAAAQVALEHPLGLGPSGFKNAFLPLAFDPQYPWLLHQRSEVGLTHNVFLTLAVEWGALAALAMLALLGWAVLRLARARGGRDDALRLGATLGAAVLFLELQVDGLEQNPLIFSLFLLLVAAALAGLPRARGVDVPARAAAALVLLLGLLGGGLMLWRAVGLSRLHAAEALAEAWKPEADPAPVRAALEAAVSSLPGELAPPAARAEFEARVLRALFGASGGTAADDPRVRAAVESGERAAALAVAADGTDPEARRLGADIALILWRRVKQRGALADYVARQQQALALDPLDVEGHFELAQEAQRGGLDELARKEFDEVFRLEPDHAFAWYLLARLREAEGDKEGALYAWDRASEAILNVRIKAQVDTPRSREFFEGLLKKVDQVEVLRRIAALRQELFS
jgi:O-antigen ligase